MAYNTRLKCHFRFLVTDGWRYRWFFQGNIFYEKIFSDFLVIFKKIIQEKVSNRHTLIVILFAQGKIFRDNNILLAESVKPYNAYEPPWTAEPESFVFDKFCISDVCTDQTKRSFSCTRKDLLRTPHSKRYPFASSDFFSNVENVFKSLDRIFCIAFQWLLEAYWQVLSSFSNFVLNRHLHCRRREWPLWAS